MGRFYEDDYDQGFTTTVPSAAQLGELLSNGFDGHEKSYRTYLDVLASLSVKHGARIFDYGCSWGYGSYQLRAAGYVVDSFDISKRRATYATEKLDIRIVQPAEQEQASYDVFFSAHVIEHVPSVARLIELGRRLLRPGGLFVAFTPNGSAAFRHVAPRNWHLCWGLVHPQLIDDEYIVAQKLEPSIVASSPYPLDEFSSLPVHRSYRGSLQGDELLFAFRR
jgi:SAM-dependent methyltransferase